MNEQKRHILLIKYESGNNNLVSGRLHIIVYPYSANFRFRSVVENLNDTKSFSYLIDVGSDFLDRSR